MFADYHCGESGRLRADRGKTEVKGTPPAWSWVQGTVSGSPWVSIVGSRKTGLKGLKFCLKEYSCSNFNLEDFWSRLYVISAMK